MARGKQSALPKDSLPSRATTSHQTFSILIITFLKPFPLSLEPRCAMTCGFPFVHVYVGARNSRLLNHCRNDSLFTQDSGIRCILCTHAETLFQSCIVVHPLCVAERESKWACYLTLSIVHHKVKSCCAPPDYGCLFLYSSICHAPI